jgi:hypothetical protein
MGSSVCAWALKRWSERVSVALCPNYLFYIYIDGEHTKLQSLGEKISNHIIEDRVRFDRLGIGN